MPERRCRYRFAAALAIFPILPNPPPLVHSSGSREDIMDPVSYGFGRWDRMEASEAARRCGACISTTRRFWPLLLGLLLGRRGREGGSAQWVVTRQRQGQGVVWYGRV